MAADTAKEECDKRTGDYRENEAGEDRDPLHFGRIACLRHLITDKQLGGSKPE
jgi:hypothetical protein